MAIDLKQYAIVTDNWEGSGNVDEVTFKANGVEGMLVRMNTSAGELRYDPLFIQQWKEAATFKRGAYVVVSPYNWNHVFTAQEYVDWIMAWKPVDCTVIGLDIEIDAKLLYGDPIIGANNKKITPKYYSDFVGAIFDGLHVAGMTCLQYSGAWFYNIVAPWVQRDWLYQWWARYPINGVVNLVNGVKIYPPITWDALKAKIMPLNWVPLIPGYTEGMTGKISIWQLASSYVLPGCPWNTPLDINILPRATFDAIWPSSPSPVTLTRDQKLDKVLGWFDTNHPQIFKTF